MRRTVLAFATLLAVCGVATAETYPSRRITVIVPFGAGSGTDGVARIVTQRLSEMLKTTIVVENRPGASGAIGAVATARSAPDGYTLMFGGSSTHAANPSLLKSIQYSPKDDFAPVSRVGLFPYILVVNPGIEAKNVGELIALAKQKPGSMSFAYSNALGQLAGEMFKRRAGIDIQAVPYKSSPEAITDVIAGRVSLMFNDVTSTLPLARSGQLRALVTITKDRTTLLSELPTIQEQGLDFGNLSAWTGVFAPKGTPPEVVEKLAESLREILAEPAVRQRLAEIGFEAQWLPPKPFAEHVATDIERWATLTKEAGIVPQ
ncbi:MULTISPECIES: tripartite tricarboxylate transporter substrate binding protein [unclassified Bradyrhizobium]|uniref:Bug family tripartite tricarboxylate transporter substrate binding protein n=1 Tax=unclassified Bradyrhizobium TaxID=2631580 RepID=UPI001BAD31CD|nr:MULTISPECIES: tripartite tricarboxylate transporter substrate binding protein [unclassified Bradyrhizobium]MBR1225681.1 tripartite tricarboxylate transporter substrate binding protein [Bradyrhizobium sp. AUGA SZCCT0176]MBR1234057.1 tripartite tricarboxylate transporter substrate binding protein [Bradyrhizobium sp. AUGA SZCCT0182]MBR1282050.1 tripartite tricarboxylate transporter substrate binding protein [Bradyrhizobium sp. AUGA SZCCT0177]MBR1298192.1 tripartite tricarboxylate transporter su